MLKKRSLINIFSAVIILFGLCGAIFSFGAIVFLNKHEQDFNNIHELGLSASSAIEETVVLLKTLDSATGNINETLGTVKNTINYTSEISYDSGEAFIEIGDLVGFEVLGFKPLSGAEQYFNNIGGSMMGLSEELILAQESLEKNASDINRIGSDIVNITADIEDVSAKFEKIVNSYSISTIATMVRYLLVYLGVINLVFILNGIMFLMLKGKKDISST